MSTLVMTSQVTHPPTDGVILASVFDTVTSTTLDAKTALITVAGVVAIFYILVKAVRSGMSLGTIAVSLLTAGLLLWGVSNTSWWQKQVGDSFNEPAPQNAMSTPMSTPMPTQGALAG